MNTKKFNIIRNRFYKVALAIYLFLYGMFENMLICLAGSEDAAKELEAQVVTPLQTVLNIILTVVQVVGGFYLVKSLADLNEAVGAHDQSGIWRAIKGILAGALFLAIKPIIKLFGYEG